MLVLKARLAHKVTKWIPTTPLLKHLPMKLLEDARVIQLGVWSGIAFVNPASRLTPCLINRQSGQS